MLNRFLEQKMDEGYEIAFDYNFHLGMLNIRVIKDKKVVYDQIDDSCLSDEVRIIEAIRNMIERLNDDEKGR